MWNVTELPKLRFDVFELINIILIDNIEEIDKFIEDIINSNVESTFKILENSVYNKFFRIPLIDDSNRFSKKNEIRKYYTDCIAALIIICSSYHNKINFLNWCKNKFDKIDFSKLNSVSNMCDIYYVVKDNINLFNNNYYVIAEFVREKLKIYDNDPFCVAVEKGWIDIIQWWIDYNENIYYHNHNLLRTILKTSRKDIFNIFRHTMHNYGNRDIVLFSSRYSSDDFTEWLLSDYITYDTLNNKDKVKIDKYIKNGKKLKSGKPLTEHYKIF